MKNKERKPKREKEPIKKRHGKENDPRIHGCIVRDDQLNAIHCCDTNT
jgi:hypothetical protein